MIRPTAGSLLVLSAAALLPSSANAAAPPTATEIVTASDRVRNPQQSFRVSLTLTEYIHGSPRDVTGLAVHAKTTPGGGQYKNLVTYTAPPRDAGKLVLLNGSSMWFYDPASKASVRISPQQRLTGQASDGDVLTVNLAHDYEAKLLGEEPVQDADKVAHTAWHLELTGSTPDAMYARLETWIEKDTYRPVKSKFYSDSGRVLKVAFYRRYEAHLGADRPTETIIVDAVDPSLVTKIAYADYRSEEAQDAWFQREYLPRFKAE